MSTDLLLFILPLLAIILAALSLAGIWVWWVSTKNKDQADGDKPDESPTLPLKTRPAEPAGGGRLRRLAGDTPGPPATEHPAPADAVEEMRVLRDASGELVVEIEGRRYRSLREIEDERVGRRFLAAAQALAGFARLADIAGSTPQAAPRDSAPEPPLPGAQPPLEPARRLGLFKRPQLADAEPVDERPVAEQIEELLQTRLATSPEFASRSIHLRSALDGGVRIVVDGEVFEGVDAVPEPQIQNFLRETIRIWEARQ